MSQHYTSNTVSVEKWCGKCQRFTQHAVSGNRAGHCIACFEKLSNRQHARDYYGLQPSRVVEIPLPCQCSAYPFAHYHADNSAQARAGRWEAARRGYLR